jgi:hypothetical protein
LMVGQARSSFFYNNYTAAEALLILYALLRTQDYGSDSVLAPSALDGVQVSDPAIEFI